MGGLFIPPRSHEYFPVKGKLLTVSTQGPGVGIHIMSRIGDALAEPKMSLKNGVEKHRHPKIVLNSAREQKYSVFIYLFAG